MKTRNTHLHEPDLPEHQLIRSSAPQPVLSSDLRERVLADCSVRIRAVRLKNRIQIAAAALAACCLVCLLVRHRGYLTDRPTPTVEKAAQHHVEKTDGQETEFESFESLGDAAASNATPLNLNPASPDDREKGSPIATDQHNTDDSPVSGAARELRSVPRDVDQLQYLIEELQQRDKKLCGVLLWR